MPSIVVTPVTVQSGTTPIPDDELREHIHRLDEARSILQVLERVDEIADTHLEYAIEGARRLVTDAIDGLFARRQQHQEREMEYCQQKQTADEVRS
jgi:hypothetical protein